MLLRIFLAVAVSLSCCLYEDASLGTSHRASLCTMTSFSLRTLVSFVHVVSYLTLQKESPTLTLFIICSLSGVCVSDHFFVLGVQEFCQAIF